jgi:hypothetical protein
MRASPWSQFQRSFHHQRESHTEIAGDIDDEVEGLRLERDTRSALPAETCQPYGSSNRPTRPRKLTLSWIILWRRMMIDARWEKSPAKLESAS